MTKLLRENLVCFFVSLYIELGHSYISACIERQGSLDVVFRQIEIVLKDSTAFVYVMQSEKSSHFTLMT